MRNYLEYEILSKLYCETKILFGEYDDSAELTYVVPTYNRYDLLRRCIKSIINQAQRNKFSIIISDNNPDTIRDFQINPDKYKFFKENNVIYSVNLCNIGGGLNCNQSVLLAKTKYICMVHDDDIIHPKHFSILDKAIQDNPNISYYCFGLKRFKLSTENDFLFLNSNIKEEPNEIISLKKLYNNYYCPMLGSLISRDAYLDVGGLGTFCNMEDYIFSYKIVEKYSGMYSYKGLYGYTIFDNDSLNSNIWNDILSEKFYLRKYIREKHKFFCIPNMLLLARDIAYIESKKNIRKMRLDKKYIFKKTNTNCFIGYVLVSIMKALLL